MTLASSKVIIDLTRDDEYDDDLPLVHHAERALATRPRKSRARFSDEDYDSDSALSPARSDVSSVSYEKNEDISPISEDVHEPPSPVDRSQSLPKKQGTRSACVSAQWLAVRHHHIPAPGGGIFSQKPLGLHRSKDTILVHVTLQKDRDGILFNPHHAVLSEQEQFIISHAVPYFKCQSRRLGRIDKVPGFSTYMHPATTEHDFRSSVQQLFSSYFMHPDAHLLRFETEFRLVQAKKEVNPPRYLKDAQTQLSDLYHNQPGVDALCAVITGVSFRSGASRRPSCLGVQSIWTHWIRVGERNEFVDRIPAFSCAQPNEDKRPHPSYPWSKDHAVLFGTGLD